MAELDYTPSQIDRMQAERASDALLTAALAPQVPSSLPGAPGGAAAPASAAARAAFPVGSRNGSQL
jgi:hypothetical protein